MAESALSDSARETACPPEPADEQRKATCPSETTAEQLAKLANLRARLRALGSIAIAFSGGVDSTLLAKVAHDELGDGAVAFTAHSASTPTRELVDAQTFCEAEGLRHLLVESHEFELEGFDQNQPDRCYHCKKEIFGRLAEMARDLGIRTIADGSNIDDANDYRPGDRALEELAVVSPLRDAGLTKADIRALSRHLGLSTWDKPAIACLNTRFAFGEKLEPRKLAMVDAAEEIVIALGFPQVRVRMQGETARIEVPPEDIARLARPDVRGPLASALKALGFAYVSLDLQGYRMGSMNETLEQRAKLDENPRIPQPKGRTMDDCLFCKIIAGEVPSKKVYEDDLFYAFDDIEPEAPVHTLVVPKQHFDNLQDDVPEELLGKLLTVVPEVAKAKGVYESGYRSVINTGPDSAATVGHLHVHILGGTKMGRFTFEGSQRLDS